MLQYTEFIGFFFYKHNKTEPKLFHLHKFVSHYKRKEKKKAESFEILLLTSSLNEFNEIEVE